MKYPAFIFLSILLCAAACFAQTENKPKEAVSLIELAKQPLCNRPRIEQLNDAVKTQPENAELHLQRAFCFQYTKNPAFLNEISTIINLDPKLSNDLFSRLNGLVLSKEPEESQANLNYLISANPNHWYPYAVRAAVKADEKDYQGAVDEWVKVFESTSLIGNSKLWRLVSMLEKSAGDKEAPGFYDRLLNAGQKRQRKLNVKLKELPVKSKEYKENRSEVNLLGDILRTLCVNWVKLAAKLGNTKMQSAALEKIVTIEARWKSFEVRSIYYKTNGNLQKAFADEVRSGELLIEAYQDEIRQAASQNQQLYFYSLICNRSSGLGDLYFRNQQYVKAIGNYEKAKPFCRYPNGLESKIKAAAIKLNLPEHEP